MSTEEHEPATTELERRLLESRALPSAGFRSHLRTHLLAGLNTRTARPARLRLMVAAYAGSGFALLLVAALGVAGAGPLAA